MTKTEFVNYYAETNNITKKQANEEIERFSETFRTATIENGGVTLIGFIKSEIKHEEPRERINPRTKEKFMSEAKDVVKVKALSKFKNMEE